MMLKVLACPSCKKPLIIVNKGLKCTACQQSYPIKQGIPLLMPKSLKTR
ncbi:MAG: Trm112 family protein [Candidatus Woesearchaeota archaeon]